MVQSTEWFTGSKAGLEKIARRRGLAYVLYELLQNAWDTKATSVAVELQETEMRGLVRLVVSDDDPDGFSDLTQSYTLFGDSEKRADPTKRGAFCFGEKLVLAICKTATIMSTKGCVVFDEQGRRQSRKRTDSGTVFDALVKMTKEERQEVLRDARLLMPPPDVRTTINGELLLMRTPLASFEAKLHTMIADEDGAMKQAMRMTTVRVYETASGDPGRLYEMGIPVCETGDPWDVVVEQKVPVNLERTSVPPWYLRAVRGVVLNAVADKLTPEQASNLGVQDGLAYTLITKPALDAALTAQFGEKSCIADPSDRDAENTLKSEGWTIIHGRSLSPEVWANVRAYSVRLPAGRIRPTPRPYSNDPNAPLRALVPQNEWTYGMQKVATFVRYAGARTIGHEVGVAFERGRAAAHWLANYGEHEITFNLERLEAELTRKSGVSRALLDIIIHELAHDKAPEHLTKAFDDELSRIGATIALAAMTESWVRETWDTEEMVAAMTADVARGAG